MGPEVLCAPPNSVEHIGVPLDLGMVSELEKGRALISALFANHQSECIHLSISDQIT